MAADYDESEIVEVRGLIAAVERGDLDRAEAENALQLIHALKVHTNARLRPVDSGPVRRRRVRARS